MPFRLTAGLIAIAMLTGTTCPITTTPSEFPKTVAWEPHTVNTGAAVRPTVVEVADFDNDNKMDVVAGYAGQDAQLPAVFIYFQADVNTFTAVQLASSADLSGVTALAVADIDGDTHRDVVVACNGRLQYLHSPADPRQSSGWMMSTIDQSSGTGIGQWSDVAVNTIDGATNGPDLVASNQNTGRLSWFKSPGPSPADGTGWLRTDIDAATRANAAGVAIADFDADTRLDVISTAPGEGGGAAPRIAWYKNPADPVADTWEKHAIGDLPSATRVILADLDADGRSDVVSINGPGRQVAWYDRPTDATTDWPGFLITQFTSNTPIDVKAADIDGNNQLDLVVATQNANTLRWFTPAPGHVQTDQWIENNLRDLEGIPSRIALGDMDGDGRPDVVVPLQGQTTAQDSIIWFENPE
ncbi:MAG TPA: VCBS repeat-containing protein [Phycisphaerae bacterium]|nr:VCBS repeat-containing protein [Phycisphaerae bacterium]